MSTLGVMFLAYLLLLALLLAGVMAPDARRAFLPPRRGHAACWARALAMQLVAWMLLAARWLLPVPWFEPLACGLLLAGYGEMPRCLAAQAGHARPKSTVVVPAVATAVVLAIAQWRDTPLEARLFIFWGCAFASLAVALWSVAPLYRHRVEWPQRALGMLFVVAVPLLGWRLAAQAVAPATGPAMEGEISLVQAAVLVYFVLLPVLSTGGFLYLRHQRRHERIEFLATHDALTGLHNRPAFVAEADAALRSAASPAPALSVLMLDIDHFKRINDLHGHAAGDDALRALASALCQATRDGDTASRFGGDEFTVLLPGAGPDDALETARRIASCVAEVQRDGHGRQPFTVSIGIASWLGADDSIDALLHRADRSLYHAKQAGRDRIEAADERKGTACA